MRGCCESCVWRDKEERTTLGGKIWYIHACHGGPPGEDGCFPPCPVPPRDWCRCYEEAESKDTKGSVQP